MSDLSEPMIFEETELIEVPVTIRGKGYLLKPLNAGSVVTYKNKATSGVVLDSEGKVVGLSNVGELEPLAVHLSLHYNDKFFEKINGQRVPLAVVNGFGGKTVQKLAERVKLISDLEEDTPETIEMLEKKIAKIREREEALKNESAPLTEPSE